MISHSPPANASKPIFQKDFTTFNLKNDDTFPQLTESAHFCRMLDVLYGKQTEGGSFTDEVTPLHPFLDKILAITG